MASNGKRNGKSKSRELARPGDPLVLAGGVVIDPDQDGHEIEQEKPIAPTEFNAATFKASQRRSVPELPAEPRTLNAIAVVILYTILGVSDKELCEAVNVEREKLKAIRTHEAYTECFNLILSELINANSDSLVARIAAHGRAAIDQIATLSTKAKGEKVRLDASKDIADRAGIRPTDNLARKVAVTNELRIVITEGSKASLELNGEQIG